MGARVTLKQMIRPPSLGIQSKRKNARDATVEGSTKTHVPKGAAILTVWGGGGVIVLKKISKTWLVTEKNEEVDYMTR